MYDNLFVCICLCQTKIKLYNLNLCLRPPSSLNIKLKKIWGFYLHWMSNYGGCLIHSIHVERNIGVLRAMVYKRICKSPSSLRKSPSRLFDLWLMIYFFHLVTFLQCLVCTNDRSVSFSLWSHVYSQRWHKEEKENQKSAKRKWVIDIQADA